MLERASVESGEEPGKCIQLYRRPRNELAHVGEFTNYAEGGSADFGISMNPLTLYHVKKAFDLGVHPVKGMVV